MKHLIALSVVLFTVLGGSLAAHADADINLDTGEVVENTDLNNEKDPFGHEIGA